MLDVAGVVYRRFLWMCVLTAGLGGPVSAQTAASAPVAGAHEPSFDVAVIRPVADGTRRNWIGMRVLPSGRVEVSGLTLQGLLYQAFVPVSSPTRLTGVPKWGQEDKFDITANVNEEDAAGFEKLSPEARLEIARPALQKLLEETFHVKLHTETRVEPVYAMVQAKGGVKLKEVPPPPVDPAEMDATLRGKGTGAILPGSMRMSAVEWEASAVKAQNIARQLAYFCNLTDRPVVDATGLTGLYDFKLAFDMEPDAPTKEQQIEEKLGLRVESRKAPITVYMVDAAEKPTLDGAE